MNTFSFSFFVVRLTLKKSSRKINLLYDRKTKLISGYLFDSEPLELGIVLEIMGKFFPPNFDEIGGFHLRFNARVTYDFLTVEGNPDVYKSVQNALNLH